MYLYHPREQFKNIDLALIHSCCFNSIKNPAYNSSTLHCWKILEFFTTFSRPTRWNAVSWTHKDVKQGFAVYFRRATRGRGPRRELTVTVSLALIRNVRSAEPEEQVRMMKGGRYYRQKMLRDDYCQTFHRPQDGLWGGPV